jgi:hypothetical protein
MENTLQKASPASGADNLFNVLVKVREVYGVRRVYVQSFQAGPLKALTGRETLTDSDIKALKSLGYSFQVEGEKLG